MKKTLKRMAQAFLIPCVLCLLNSKANAQDQAKKLAPEQLLTTLSKIDSALFASFNHCDIQQFRTFFAEDLEFYHDKGGPTYTMKKFTDDFANGLCKPGNAWKSRRELVPGSLKAYPMNGFGAILEGEHRFYETELATGKEYRRSTAKFTFLFQEKNGTWKIVRALSYDHRMPDGKAY
jgi:hypothetical protein